MDSTLAVQQFIQQSIARDASSVDEILTPPDGQDEGVWKYEHLRYSVQSLHFEVFNFRLPDQCSR